MGFMTTEEAEDIEDAEYTDLSNKDKLNIIAEQAAQVTDAPQPETNKTETDGKDAPQPVMKGAKAKEGKLL